ncbi:uncharacterized protein C8Q71DRAFT_209172 [Rhodofomes roseus]|uniref:AB hydrolase-1 domain-containing protein n=1 Tax=Rhodofomes roseus TaxID=34475 RepID=A0ABQ8KW37_9APHY|nr:uncharacterized protein C8Q71DRAFT_209172 [Rhodofomes roseus]KAH9842573.1 hypothetical protein C8Q71DRAFT_209172 [Rhodofomes roseus]
MKTFSFPRPERPAQRRCPRPPRDLLPLEAIPDDSNLPSLPSPPRKFSDPSYTLTTHLVPVALPRSTPEVPLPATSARVATDAGAVSLAKELIAIRDSYWDGELNLPNSTKPLWACVNRYVRRDINNVDGGKGVTLVLAHANGYHKEIWEPTIAHMIRAQNNSSSQVQIDEVWSWEPWNHGDAFLINERNAAACMFDGRDNARDILQFLLYYLPTLPSSAPLPVHLERLSDGVAASRKSRGFEGRQLVGVGHSLGGCAIARLAIAEPRVFSSLILVEAGVVAYPGSGPLVDKRTFPYLVYAIKRKSRWPSREQASADLSTSPFFSTWDSAALSVYVECGLRDDPRGGVTLKMPSTQEAMTYTDMLTMYETWDLIDDLDERVELRWILAGKIGKGEEWFRETTSWRRPANSSNVVFSQAGHLIVMEAPEELGKEIFSFIEHKSNPLHSKL